MNEDNKKEREKEENYKWVKYESRKKQKKKNWWENN